MIEKKAFASKLIVLTADIATAAATTQEQQHNTEILLFQVPNLYISC